MSKQSKKAKSDAQRQANFNKWLTIGGILAAVVVIGLWINSRRVPVAQETITREANEVQVTDWTKGNPDAEVIITEYSDFQCPACRSYYPLLADIAETYSDQVLFVYRHFPLIQIHLQAETAAHVAEAAGKQGKFWEMHDKLFDTQDEWSQNPRSNALFSEYAQEIGLNVDQFEADLDSQEVKAKVKGDRLNAIGLGLNGTPSLFVNGEKIDNPASKEDFEAIILEALGEEATPSAESSTDESIEE